jgi:hypothetical protein
MQRSWREDEKSKIAKIDYNYKKILMILWVIKEINLT